MGKNDERTRYLFGHAYGWEQCVTLNSCAAEIKLVYFIGFD